MAATLNRSFTYVFTAENTETVFADPYPPRRIESLGGTSCEKRVHKYLDKADSNKSTGPDNVFPRVLKELKQQ